MKAKVFMSGGSQAVRLPAEYRFDCAEVEIRRDVLTGDIILSRPLESWDEYFEWAAKLGASPDFLADRQQPQDDLKAYHERRPVTRRGVKSRGKGQA